MPTDPDRSSEFAASRGSQRGSARGLIVVLTAICTVVGLVSVPCVEVFARRANEEDARVALHLLEDALDGLLEADEATQGRLQLEHLLEESGLLHRLVDARLVREDQFLYHGYIITWEQRTPGRLGELVARPRIAGTTGRADYVLDLDRGDLSRVSLAGS